MRITKDQIINWISKHFKYKISSGGRQIQINNPFDGDDGYHFWVSTQLTPLKRGPKKGTMGYWVNDFRPGNHIYHSSFLKFVSTYRNISYQQAVSEVTGLSSNDVRTAIREVRYLRDKQEEKEVIEAEITLPPLSKPLKDDNSMAASMVRRYLHGRMVTDDKINSLGIHYTPSSVVFPYYEFGILVYWQERSILNKRFNFPNEEETGVGKTDFIYGFDNVETPNNPVVVVESIFNSLSIFDNCIASGGAIVSGRQPKKLQYLDPSFLILAPDNDEAGRKSLRQNFFLLKNEFKLAYSLPPRDMDWNELEQQRGKGSALEYLKNNTHWLALPQLLALGT